MLRNELCPRLAGRCSMDTVRSWCWELVGGIGRFCMWLGGVFVVALASTSRVGSQLCPLDCCMSDVGCGFPAILDSSNVCYYILSQAYCIHDIGATLSQLCANLLCACPVPVPCTTPAYRTSFRQLPNP